MKCEVALKGDKDIPAAEAQGMHWYVVTAKGEKWEARVGDPVLCLDGRFYFPRHRGWLKPESIQGDYSLGARVRPLKAGEEITLKFDTGEGW